jgi:hypothetical protein
MTCLHLAMAHGLICGLPQNGGRNVRRNKATWRMYCPPRFRGEGRVTAFGSMTTSKEEDGETVFRHACKLTLAHEPGLIGYECPACCYVTSVILQPKRR